MYFSSIDEYLRRETTSEQWHKEHPGQRSNLYYNLRYFKEVKEGIYYTNFSPELTINDLIVMKESRYTKLYPGFHDYYEITFLYSGSSVYYINNKEIRLNSGDLILIQKGVVRASDYTGEDDIIMNIVFKEEMVNLNFLHDFSGNGDIYTFFSNNFFRKGNEDGYIVIRNHGNHLLDLALECICTLYYSERKFNYAQLMFDYFRVLFQQLITTIHDGDSAENKKGDLDYIIYQVLNYIANHYQNGSLRELAAQLGYNYNYLSNLIKQKMGRSFAELKQEYRLNIAYRLIKNGDLPIYEICQQCGFLNRSYFYQKFEQRYQISPKKLRQQERLLTANK